MRPSAATLVICTLVVSGLTDLLFGDQPDTMAVPKRQAVLMGFGPGAIDLPYESSFVGSEECANCHTDHARMQPASNMFLTGRAVTLENADTWFSKEMLDKPVRWPEGEFSKAPQAPRYRRRDDGVYLEGITKDDEPVAARVDVVFGSGRHAITPLSGEPGHQSRELRVTYSYVQDSWIMTPGSFRHTHPVGYVRPPEETENCFFCHGSRIVWNDDLVDDESQFGVHCERCHGPGSAHIDAVIDGDDDQKILNPASLSAREQVEFCGQCHRRSSDVEPLAALKREMKIARHAGLGHMLSKCFRLAPADEVLTCLECHNPHRNVDPENDDYNSPCARCHAEPEKDHTTIEAGLDADCVSCHMPYQEDAFEAMDFTDHWIRVPGMPPPFKSPEKREYADYLEASYRGAIERTTTGAERRTRYRMRLGELLFGMGREEEGLEWIGKALTFGPLHRDRLIAGELYERGGQPEKAIPVLEEAIRLAQDNNRAYYTLTRLYLRQRNLSASADVLDRWAAAIDDDDLHAEMTEQWMRLRRRLKSTGG